MKVRGLSLRLTSLALAAVLWFVIAGRQTAERGLSIPIELRNVPRALELTGDSVNTVEVRVRASPGLIDTLDPDRVLATVDLAGTREGERIVPLTPGQIRVPFGFRVVRITPSLLNLKLERTEHKQIPVRPRIVGLPAAGFELAEVACQPAQVPIAGPRSRVTAIENAHTEPVSVEGATATVQETVNVGLGDPALRLEGDSGVRVTALVREAHQSRVFEGLEIETQGAAARTEPSRVTVIVSGPTSQVRALDASDLRPYVTVPVEGRSPERLPIAVAIGSGHPGVSVVEKRPAEVAVRLGPRSRSARD